MISHRASAPVVNQLAAKGLTLAVKLALNHLQTRATRSVRPDLAPPTAPSYPPRREVEPGAAGTKPTVGGAPATDPLRTGEDLAVAAALDFSQLAAARAWASRITQTW
jgi:hypothetical protein